MKQLQAHPPTVRFTSFRAETRREKKEKFKTLVSDDGGRRHELVRGGRGRRGTGRALLELTPHKMAVCHLVQVFAPPAQAGGDVVPPFPFESLAHHNRLGLFLFTLTQVRPRALASLLPPSKIEMLLLVMLGLPCALVPVLGDVE